MSVAAIAVLGVMLLAAFWLGAWVRQPFRLPGLPKLGGRQTEDTAAKRYERQKDAVLGYTVETARKAADEEGRGV